VDREERQNIALEKGVFMDIVALPHNYSFDMMERLPFVSKNTFLDYFLKFSY
jgi:hypothetical protein